MRHVELHRSLEHPRRVLYEQRPELLTTREVPLHSLLLELPHELGRGRNPDVGGDEDLLDPLPELLVVGVPELRHSRVELPDDGLGSSSARREAARTSRQPPVSPPRPRHPALPRPTRFRERLLDLAGLSLLDRSLDDLGLPPLGQHSSAAGTSSPEDHSRRSIPGRVRVLGPRRTLDSAGSSLSRLKKLRHERAMNCFSTLPACASIQQWWPRRRPGRRHRARPPRPSSASGGSPADTGRRPCESLPQQETRQVEIVERSLRLVEHTERPRIPARTAQEDAEEERKREQRPLPPDNTRNGFHPRRPSRSPTSTPSSESSSTPKHPPSSAGPSPQTLRTRPNVSENRASISRSIESIMRLSSVAAASASARWAAMSWWRSRSSCSWERARRLTSPKRLSCAPGGPALRRCRAGGGSRAGRPRGGPHSLSISSAASAAWALVRSRSSVRRSTTERRPREVAREGLLRARSVCSAEGGGGRLRSGISRRAARCGVRGRKW